MSVTFTLPEGQLGFFNLNGYSARAVKTNDGMYAVHVEEPLDSEHVDVSVSNHETPEAAIAEFTRVVMSMLHRIS